MGLLSERTFDYNKMAIARIFINFNNLLLYEIANMIMQYLLSLIAIVNF